MPTATGVSLRHFLGWLVSVFRSREDLVLENLALRRQLLALHAQHPRRRLTALHKLFWVALRMFWSGWTKPLILVTPRTVVNWHRAGFRLYWTWVSRVSQVGRRKRVSKEVRALIFRMVSENPTWGAPRIHGELLMLGFSVSQATVSRYIRRCVRPRSPGWRSRGIAFGIGLTLVCACPARRPHGRLGHRVHRPRLDHAPCHDR